MSNLLNEAIVDAKALREAALKNAETIVIEKYSNDVKETLEKLLEQEDDLDAMLGGTNRVISRTSHGRGSCPRRRRDIRR